jgi:hypothetical protein
MSATVSRGPRSWMRRAGRRMLTIVAAVVLAAGGVAVTPAPAAAATKINRIDPGTLKFICALLDGRYDEDGNGLYVVPADGGPITFPAVPDPDPAGRPAQPRRGARRYRLGLGHQLPRPGG